VLDLLEHRARLAIPLEFSGYGDLVFGGPPIDSRFVPMRPIMNEGIGGEISIEISLYVKLDVECC
jgi:hypothetical protein